MDSALFAIRQHIGDMPSAEKKIAQYVLDEPRKIIHVNITELARQCGASQAAVVRFCRRIGAEGYSSFKLWLSHDVFRGADEKILPELELEQNMDGAHIIKGVLGGIQRSFARLEAICDANLLNSAAAAIRGARMNHIFGVGASGLVAQDFFQKLSRIGIPCSNSLDADMQITLACNLKKEDIAFIISYSGENNAMKIISEQAKKKGAAIITLTMESDNTLRRTADISLVVPSLESVYRIGASISRINQFAVIDMIYSMLVANDLENCIMAFRQTMAATHTIRSYDEENSNG